MFYLTSKIHENNFNTFGFVGKGGGGGGLLNPPPGPRNSEKAQADWG